MHMCVHSFCMGFSAWWLIFFTLSTLVVLLVFRLDNFFLASILNYLTTNRGQGKQKWGHRPVNLHKPLGFFLLCSTKCISYIYKPGKDVEWSPFVDIDGIWHVILMMGFSWMFSIFFATGCRIFKKEFGAS